MLNTSLPLKSRAAAALKAAWFYARWYPQQWLPLLPRHDRQMHPALRGEFRTVNRLSRQLARRLFHATIRFGPKLDKQQLLLGRFVEIGAELFALSASVGHAQRLLASGEAENEDHLIDLVAFIGQRTRRRVRDRFRRLHDNEDRAGYALAQETLHSPGNPSRPTQHPLIARHRLQTARRRINLSRCNNL